MNEVDQVLKQIDQLKVPVRKVVDTLNKVIPPYVQRLNEALGPTVQRLNEITKAYEPFLSQINATLAKAAEAAKKWQIARKEDITVMAENGWYPNWYTFFYYPEIPIDSLDELI